MRMHREFYIGGQWVVPHSDQTHVVLDPSTGAPFATISLADAQDVDRAVAAARDAWPDWAATSPRARRAVLTRIAEVYEARLEDLAQTISREVGAPIDLARKLHAPSGLRHTRDFIAALDDFPFEFPLRADTPNDMILRDPIGVAAMITPWNRPLNQIALKVIPALATGCTMVLKPSEIAPISAMMFAQILHDAGVPPGVFNLINGDGAGAGTALSAHPDVDMISFTGSTRAGIAISKNAADTVKRVQLELGGKGANIVFADADPDAVTRGVQQCFKNSGQACNAPSRMLVERAAYDAAVDTARVIATTLTTGPADAPGNHIGPVVGRAQYDKVRHLIQSGLDQGARLIAGGPERPAALPEGGFYIQPTVFADVTPDMDIAKTEIFGPVLAILPFDTEDQAIQIANDTPYGLTNFVQSCDREKCRRVARQLRSGMVELNGTTRAAGTPFGGMRHSGNGREAGIWGLDAYCEIKAISGW